MTRIRTFLLTALLASGAAQAGGPVPGVGVATEFTQVANNVQLAAENATSLRQLASDLERYRVQLQQLRQLDPSKLDKMLLSRLGLKNVDELAQTLRDIERINNAINNVQDDMDVLIREGQISVEVAAKLKSKGIDLTPKDYLQGLLFLAQQKEDVYGERVKALQKATENAKSDLDRINQIAENSKNIQSHVEGLQSIIQTNAILSNQLADLNTTMRLVAQQQAEQAKSTTMLDEYQRAKLMGEAQMYSDWFSQPANRNGK